jgi:cytochrome c biogenesis protein CcmG/thiol:disulfide interchange protein DsbE
MTPHGARSQGERVAERFDRSPRPRGGWGSPSARMLAVVVLASALAYGVMELRTPSEDDAADLARVAPGAGGEKLAEPLPAVDLQPLGGGQPVTLAEDRGTPLLLSFWASWCVPCVEEMPELQAVADVAGQQLALVGVTVQDAPANATAFARDLGITYDLLEDPVATFFTEVGGFGLPTTLLVDEAGTIVYRHVGIMDRSEIADALAEHLEVHLEPAPPH